MLEAKRIGKWLWALSSEERMTAALIDQARGGPAVSARVKRAHAAMLVKQAKLQALDKRVSSESPSRRLFGS
jgi:hypothetical protein